MSDDKKEVSLADLEEDWTKNTPAGDDSHAQSELDFLDHEQQTFRNELGWLGRPFGGRKEKPGNISGLVIVACFVFLIIAYLYPPQAKSEEKLEMMTFEQIFSGLMSIVTLILGYLFGSNDRS